MFSKEKEKQKAKDGSLRNPCKDIDTVWDLLENTTLCVLFEK